MKKPLEKCKILFLQDQEEASNIITRSRRNAAHTRSRTSKSYDYYYSDNHLVCDDIDSSYAVYYDYGSNNILDIIDSAVYQYCSEENCDVSNWISDDDPSFTGDHENFVWV